MFPKTIFALIANALIVPYTSRVALGSEVPIPTEDIK